MCVCARARARDSMYTLACVCLCACIHSYWSARLTQVGHGACPPRVRVCECGYVCLRGRGRGEWSVISHRLNVRNVRYVYGSTAAHPGFVADPAMLDIDWTLLCWPQALRQRGATPLHQASWQTGSEDTVPFNSRPGNPADRVSVSEWWRHPEGTLPLGTWQRTESSLSVC